MQDVQESVSDIRLQGEKIRTYGVIFRMQEVKKRARFVVVKCPDCSTEQIVFERASTVVACKICGSTLATPTGGTAKFKAQILRSADNAAQS